jgi:glycosyltransferase involved in cell wall biosynthesis
MNDEVTAAAPLRLGTMPEAGPVHDVVFYPDYRKANLYQELLRRSLDPRFTVHFAAIEDARTMLATNKLDRHLIFHLHWEDAVFTGIEAGAEAWSSARRMVEALERLVDEGGSLLWTIHNDRPHRNRFPDAYRELRRGLGQLADLCVVHGPSAAAALVAADGLPEDRLVVIPHGHYGDAYDFEQGERDATRAKLQLPQHKRVFLLFGRLDSYKGITRLLEAFARLDEDAHLVIAGHAVGDALQPLEDVSAGVRERIVVRAGFVPETEVPSLFAAADVVVLPYEEIFTSGGLLLALSAARPVIAPDVPTLADVVRDGREGWLFTPRSTASLAAALSAACRIDAAGLARLGSAACRTAHAYPWSRSGRMTSALYAYLVHTRRPRRRFS